MRADHDRVQLELELSQPIVSGGGSLHGCRSPLLLVVEAHQYRNVFGSKPVDRCANGKIAVAANGCVAWLHDDRTHGYGFARQVGPEQEVTAAEAPGPRTECEERNERKERAAGNASRR